MEESEWMNEWKTNELPGKFKSYFKKRENYPFQKQTI